MTPLNFLDSDINTCVYNPKILLLMMIASFILLGLAQILKRILPVIEESKTLV